MFYHGYSNSNFKIITLSYVLYLHGFLVSGNGVVVIMAGVVVAGDVVVVVVSGWVVVSGAGGSVVFTTRN